MVVLPILGMDPVLEQLDIYILILEILTWIFSVVQVLQVDRVFLRKSLLEVAHNTLQAIQVPPEKQGGFFPQGWGGRRVNNHFPVQFGALSLCVSYLNCIYSEPR